jgi:hypothetical protein
LSPSADRGASRARLGAPHLVPLAAVAAALFLIWRFGGALLDPSLATAAAGADAQVRAALQAQRRASLEDVYGFRSGGRVSLEPVTFGDVTVSAEGGRARVFAIVNAQGTVAWRGEEAALGYVGNEAFAMSRCRSAPWCADGEQFAQLRGVLTALFRRADAAAARDPEAALRLASEAYSGGKPALAARLARAWSAAAAGPEPVPHIRAWQVRVERDRATAGEDYDLVAPDGARERRRAVYALAREGDRWVFVDGL